MEMVHLYYFNSIKVQLKHTLISGAHPAHNNFNSIKVQLKHPQAVAHMARDSHFNSIKVQLKLNEHGTQIVILVDFNSIKVQLKRKALCCVHPRKVFQFHKGTIKTQTRTSTRLRRQ